MSARHALSAAAAGAAVLLAACGGGSGDDLTGDKPDDAKRLAFATCLRKAGVDVREQPGSGGIDIRVPEGISKARMARIESNCARKTGGGPGRGREPSPAEKARFLDQALKFARCMRAHGVDMADPKADGHGIRLEINGATGKPDSPLFRRAQQACASFNPKGPDKGGSGPGGKK